jgi:surface antigen
MNNFLKVKIGVLLMPIFFFILIFSVVILGAIGGAKKDSNNGNGDYGYVSISKDVLKYKVLVEEYCNKYEIPDQVNIVLAIMMQESGGRGLDPMQASECAFNTRYPRVPNGITDPVYSIEVGVQNWASVWKEAGELKLALQGYNFGNGYIQWAKERGGYTLENAKEFSSMMASKLGWSLYGDVLYVEHVMRYISPINWGDDTFKAMMNEVLKYEGYPYVFGGETPETSFDCSGLTKWAYKIVGVELPRTAQQQYDSMRHIALSEAEAGDLVFFTNTYATSDYITHVGIIVDSNTMYHAGDPIGYTNLNLEYWQLRLVGAGTIK